MPYPAIALNIILADSWVLGDIKVRVGQTRSKVFSNRNTSALFMCIAALPTLFLMLLHTQRWKCEHEKQWWTASFAIELCLSKTRMYRFIVWHYIQHLAPSHLCKLSAPLIHQPKWHSAPAVLLSVAPGREMTLSDGFFSLRSIVFLPLPFK